MPPFKKLLVANRGEIAIRVFRAATELGIPTVAIFAWEDRFSLHRYKADESYQLAPPGNPVASYLDIDAIISIAKKAGVDAIHPGYGFLSERKDFREKCEKEKITFIGPSSETLELTGNKVKTRELAQSLDIPLIEGSSEITALAEAESFAKKVGFPVIFKASYGGGGRGMRVAHDATELSEDYQEAKSEAELAFGREEIFLEKYITNPRHIEVQLLGDGNNNVVHLFERDCSVQRRHQKIIEYAPALSLSDSKKSELYAYAIKLAKALNLKSASTAEFLVSENEEIFFIEINPRIQVEHTVTEEVTGVDLVQSQIKIASGQTLEKLGIAQESLSIRGCAIQCRITTEDAAKDFEPDYGTLVTYRSASGFGIRLDAGSAFAGAEVLPFYDSLLVKVTATGETMAQAAGRLSRALVEFRIRGVKSNIPFLSNIIKHEDFLQGRCHTNFIKAVPELYKFPRRKNRANRLLRYLGEVKVNGHELMPGLKRPENLRVPEVPFFPESEVPSGWRNLLLEQGKEEFLKKLKNTEELLITDTSYRDAHQSLLATRLRSIDMLNIANCVARRASGLFSIEMWGGATFDVSLRFLKEDPWERLETLREKIPNIPFQMLARGSNAVGYTRYPDNVIVEFIKQAHKSGIDIFRIFDCLNSIDKMRVSIDAVKETGGIAEVCICYTGDLVAEEAAGKNGKFNLSYYKKLAEDLEKAGAEILAIKDMAGLLRPESGKLLISELDKVCNLPVHLHSHDTAGGQIATYLKASEAGVSVVDCAFSAVSGVTSQPSLEGLVRSIENTKRQSSLEPGELLPVSSYWETIRDIYQPFESDLKTSTAEVYINEIPGGQYSNLKPQAESLGLGDKVQELKDAYTAVNHLFGRIVKVTPSSKVVGDLALFMVANNLTVEDLVEQAGSLSLPESVVSFLRGEIGVPYGGFPEEFRAKVLKGEKSVDLPPLPPADFEQAASDIKEFSKVEPSNKDILSYLLYPRVFKDFAKARDLYGRLMVLPSESFFYGLEEGKEISVELEPGKLLYISLVTLSETDDKGRRTVFFDLNGQTRGISVVDQSSGVKVEEHLKADSANPAHIGAPLAGVIVEMSISGGDSVAAGDPLFVLEAMKMQTVVSAQSDCKISEIKISSGTRVSGGDLVMVVETQT